MKAVMVVLFILCTVAFSGCTKKSTQAIEGKLTGKIFVSPALEKNVQSTDVLYIIARHQQIGPPSAVLRVVNPKFPFEYVIGPENAMIPGMPGFEPGTPLTVSARLTHGGDAKGKTGDLEGVYNSNPTKPGNGGVDVVLDRLKD